jgi:hypothetical protein
MGQKRIVTVTVVAVLALILADAALTENYQYKRTAQDDARAAAIVFQRSDLARTHLTVLKGGRVKPDETPNPSRNRCNPQQSDLAITGDAESSYSDGSGESTIDSQVNLFKTTAMASTDWNRQSPTDTAACLRESMKNERNPSVSLVSLSRLPTIRCRYQNTTFLVEVAYKLVAKPSVRYVFVITQVQSGRTEVTVTTSLRLDATAMTRARNVQAVVLGAMLPRLSAC